MNVLRKLVALIHPRAAVVLHDTAMVWLAWMATNILRYSLTGQDSPVAWFGVETGIVMLVQTAILGWVGLYKGLWRFASLPDLWNIVRAAALGALISALALFLYNRLATVPRSVLLLYPLVLTVLLGLPRMAWRYWKDSRLDLFQAVPSKRVLVVGASPAGEALARDLKREGHYRVVGFVDDDPSLRGTRVHGVPVLGRIERLPELAREVAAEMILLALPSANSIEMRRVVDVCEDSGVPFRTVPRLEDVVSGRSQFNQLKEVAIEDLLGREPVELDWTAIREHLTGKRVLVTGGGGSIGSELCRQVARLGASSLTILDQSEFNLYQIERELRAAWPELLLTPVLGDCVDAVAVEHVFVSARPEVVFHAAAYKHVPLLEQQAREAFRNNVLATRVVSTAADRHRAGSMVMISTDKAVNPSSVMGACKRVAEMWCQNLAARSATRYITVRFGNVLDSAGSVVPLFREQIARGGPVTVTHPEIARYFMTIPEACQLILQAGTLGSGGEIYALDMGEPVGIRYLAEQMIRLAGKRPEIDIPIVYTGLRPGEKLFEELFHPLEDYRDTAHRKIFLAHSRSLGWDMLCAQVERGTQAVADFDDAAVLRTLSALVPEFSPRPPASVDNVLAFTANQTKERS
ncbi:MAG TPA: nucleoside-diphosphate sugar epimerase/dehydratase [Rhodanobacteraceae bacterium]|nr:nucleoside-diphosphate sugar epimerase/dehydratase [Rhodanobacteraceae bacterium]